MTIDLLRKNKKDLRTRGLPREGVGNTDLLQCPVAPWETWVGIQEETEVNFIEIGRF